MYLCIGKRSCVNWLDYFLVDILFFWYRYNCLYFGFWLSGYLINRKVVILLVVYRDRMIRRENKY